MKVTVFPSDLSGSIMAPSSKSHFQRLLIGALLSDDQSNISYYSRSEDDRAVEALIRKLGALVVNEQNLLKIGGGMKPANSVISCGESGLCMRMMTPLLGLSGNETTIIAEGSLQSRPQEFMIETLKQLGVKLHSDNGKAPLKIKGPMKGGQIQLDGSFSSQFLSGLLMALPLASGDSEILVSDLVSRNYVQLTLEVLRDFQLEVRHEDFRKFNIPGNQKYRGVTTNVEGDWSGAANFFVAGLLAGDISITNLSENSSQADKSIIDLINKSGAQVPLINECWMLKKQPVQAINWDLTDSPDLFPPVVALASAITGRSTLKGIHRLRHKESDRARALLSEFSKLGIRIMTTSDSMYIEGGEARSAQVSSHNDHRIAMALAVRALRASGPVVIEQAECVRKSYPGFWDDLKSLGAKLVVQD